MSTKQQKAEYNAATTMFHHEIETLFDEMGWLSSKEHKSFFSSMTEQDIEDIANEVANQIGHDRPTPAVTVLSLKEEKTKEIAK